MIKQLVKIALAIMTTLLGAAILWQFRIVVVYFLISIMLAATLRPLVNRSIRPGILIRVTRVILYMVILASFGFLLYLAGKVAFREIQQLANAISTQDQWRLPIWLKGSLFQQVLVARLLPPAKLLQIATYGLAEFVVPAMIGLTQRIASIVSGIVVILILSLYWIAGKNNFERLWLSLLPSGQRGIAREIWLTIELDLGANIRRLFIHSFLVVVLLGLGFRLIGSPYPLLMALVCGLVCLIPFLGGALAVILPLLIGLLTGMQLTSVMVLYTIIVLIVLSVWVEPRFFHRRWDNPILTLVIIIALASVFGLLGIIVAPLISSVIQILWSLLINQRIASVAAEGNFDFRQRLERIRATLEVMGETPPPLVSSTMERLNQLVDKAEPLLQAAKPVNPEAMVVPDSHQPDIE